MPVEKKDYEPGKGPLMQHPVNPFKALPIQAELKDISAKLERLIAAVEGVTKAIASQSESADAIRFRGTG